MSRKLLFLLSRERIVYLLRHPQANPKETVLVFGLFASLILILLLIIWIILTPPPKPASIEGRKARKGTFRNEFLLTLEVAVFAFLILFLAVSFSTPFPATCKSCHLIRESYDSWKASSHQGTRCTLCHQKPGVIGFAIGKLEYFQMIPSYLLNSYKEPIVTAVGNSSCLRCHWRIMDGVVESGRVRVSHRELLRTGFECTDCHGNAGHRKIASFARLPKMDKCVLCHDGKKASNKCSFCHLAKYASQPRLKITDFPRVDLRVTDCEGCHPTDKCTQCHGIYMPHPPGFKNAGGHARPAFTQRDVCAKCHPPTECLQCHSQVGTHGKQWVSEHAQAAANPQSCFICGHQNYVSPPSNTVRSKYFCDNCHETMPKPRPGIPQPEVPEN